MERSLRMTFALVSLLSLAATWSCSHDVTGPAPKVDGVPLAVDPGIVCRDQLTTAVVIHGKGFSPIPVDLPGDPGTDLPAVSLVRGHDLDGAAAAGEVVTYGGKKGEPNAGLLSWQESTSMTFVVNQAIALADGSKGALPPGVWDVMVTNPNGTATGSLSALAVVPKPTLLPAKPPIVCLAQGDRQLDLSGTGFVTVGDLQAVFVVDGVEKPFAMSDFGECIKIAHPVLTARTCGTAKTILAKDSVAPGFPAVSVLNPQTAPCKTEEPVHLRVVPPPAISSVDPPMVCVTEGPREVVVTGTGFLEIDGALPEVSVGGAKVEVKGLEDCQDLETMTAKVRTCTRAKIVVPQQDVPEPAQPEVMVTNPDPAGCQDSNTGGLVLVPKPAVMSADPPLICNAQADRDVTFAGTGFLSVGGVLPAVALDGKPVVVKSLDQCQAVPVQGLDVQICKRVLATVPKGTVAEGHPKIELANPQPAGCGATNLSALTVTPPPVIDSLDPPAVCVAQGDVAVTVNGAGFLTVGGVPASVSIGGKHHIATAKGCTPVEVQGLEVTTCTSLTVTVPKGDLPAGEAVVVVTNPMPAGCDDTAVQPLLVVDPPLVLAATPPMVCTGKGDQEVVLTGSGFLELGGVGPTVSMNGDAMKVASLGGCVEKTLVGLTWKTCTEVHVTVSKDSLAPGAVHVEVRNPQPVDCSTASDELLVVPPLLAIDGVDPQSICSAAGDKDVIVRGDGFLVVGGVEPGLALGGKPFTIKEMGDCTPVDAPGFAVQSCKAMTVTIAKGAFQEGDVPVEVSNPPPADCSAAKPGVFYIVPKPALATVVPAEFCSATGGTLTLTGNGFTPVMQVKLVGASDVFEAVETVFVDPSKVTAKVGPGLDPGTYGVRAVNAEGCQDELPAAVKVQPSPLVFFADPPVLYSGVSIQATIYVSGLTAAAAKVRVVGPGNQEVVLNGQSKPGEPNRIVAQIPAGLVAGEWAVEVTSQSGCVGTLAGGLKVTDDLSVAIDAIEPGFVAPGHPTAVTIKAPESLPAGKIGFESTPRVYLNPDPAPEGTLAAAMRAVVFVDGKTLTAVVPAGVSGGGYKLAPGTYDLIVVNPGATVGVLSKALTVTESEPPSITSVVPGSLDNNGPVTGVVTGENFSTSGVTIDLTCRDPITGVKKTAPAPVAGGTLTATSVKATFPSDQFAAGNVCVVRLTNTDGSSFNYSAISIKNPAQNLYPWGPGSPMVEKRRAPALTAGRPTQSSRYLYAIGGDGGSAAGAKASVESASVDVFGDMGAWAIQRNPLPAGRTFTGVARIGGFVYLAGGNDGTGPTAKLLRSRILDPLATPEVVDVSLAMDKAVEGLGPGLWHYRVSAAFPGDDPDNPGGESLPGETLVVQLPDVKGMKLTFTWSEIEGASGYRLYRTPQAGEGVDAVELLGETAGAGATWFTDTGGKTAQGVTPLPPGSLGVWHEVKGAALLTAREGHTMAVAAHPAMAGKWLVYAFGGRGPGGAYLASYEWTTVIEGAGGGQTIAAWTAGSKTLSDARADLGAFVVTGDDVPVLGPGESWIFVGPGNGAGGVTTQMDAAPVKAAGDLGAFLKPGKKAPANAGYGFGDANGFLFMFGGGGGAATSGGLSGELCTGEGLGGCNPDQLPEIRNWNSLGISLGESRLHMGSAQESAFFFVAGGTNGMTVTNTVDMTVQ